MKVRNKNIINSNIFPKFFSFHILSLSKKDIKIDESSTKYMKASITEDYHSTSFDSQITESAHIKETFDRDSINKDIECLFPRFPKKYIYHDYVYSLLKYIARTNHHEKSESFSYYGCYNHFKKDKPNILFKEFNQFMRFMASKKLIELYNKDNGVKKHINIYMLMRVDWVFFKKPLDKTVEFSTFMLTQPKIRFIAQKIHILDSLDLSKLILEPAA